MDRLHRAVAGPAWIGASLAFVLAAPRSASSSRYALTTAATLATILAAALGAGPSPGITRASWPGCAPIVGVLLHPSPPRILAHYAPSRGKDALHGLGSRLVGRSRASLDPSRRMPRERSGYLGRVIFLRLNLLFALAGGFVDRGFAIRAESGTRVGHLGAERRES